MFNPAELAVLAHAVDLYGKLAVHTIDGTAAVRDLARKLEHLGQLDKKVAFTYGDRELTGTLQEIRDADGDGGPYARIASRGFLYLVELTAIHGLA